MFNGISRRKKPRFSVSIDGYYKLREKEWEKCRFFDVNLEGAGFKLNEELKKEDVLTIKFDVQQEEEDEVLFKALVVNNRDYRYGIKFIDLNKDKIAFLKKIINAYSNRFEI